MEAIEQTQDNYRRFRYEGLVLLFSLLSYGVFIGLALVDEPDFNSSKNPPSKLIISLATPSPQQAKPSPPKKARTKPKAVEPKPVKPADKPVTQAQRRIISPSANTDRRKPLDLSIPKLRTTPQQLDQLNDTFSPNLRQQLNSQRVQRLNRPAKARTPAIVNYQNQHGEEVYRVGDSCVRRIETIPGQYHWFNEACIGPDKKIFKNWKNGQRIR